MSAKTTTLATHDYAPGWVVGCELITYGPEAGEDLAGTTRAIWYGEHNGRRIFSGYPSREVLEATVDEAVRDDQPVQVWFADGNHYDSLPRGTANQVIGLDAFGFLVAESDGLRYALTPCCHVSGKGGGHGVVCRSCYEDVDDYFGWFAEVHPGRERTEIRERGR